MWLASYLWSRWTFSYVIPLSVRYAFLLSWMTSKKSKKPAPVQPVLSNTAAASAEWLYKLTIIRQNLKYKSSLTLATFKAFTTTVDNHCTLDKDRRCCRHCKKFSWTTLVLTHKERCSIMHAHTVACSNAALPKHTLSLHLLQSWKQYENINLNLGH